MYFVCCGVVICWWYIVNVCMRGGWMHQVMIPRDQAGLKLKDCKKFISERMLQAAPSLSLRPYARQRCVLPVFCGLLVPGR